MCSTYLKVTTWSALLLYLRLDSLAITSDRAFLIDMDMHFSAANSNLYRGLRRLSSSYISIHTIEIVSSMLSIVSIFVRHVARVESSECCVVSLPIALGISENRISLL